jgi:hypothetical protein
LSLIIPEKRTKGAQTFVRGGETTINLIKTKQFFIVTMTAVLVLSIVRVAYAESREDEIRLKPKETLLLDNGEYILMTDNGNINFYGAKGQLKRHIPKKDARLVKDADGKLLAILKDKEILLGKYNIPEYVGVKNCKMCHIKQYEAWKKTGMSTSFENLKAGVKAEEKKRAGLDSEKDYTHDARCLKCHTTGYGRPGGFKSLEETPDLINVQCEGCHGPGAYFRKIMNNNKEFKLADAKLFWLILPNERENTCMECHAGDSPFNIKLGSKYKFDIKDRLKRTHEHFALKYEH